MIKNIWVNNFDSNFELASHKLKSYALYCKLDRELSKTVTCTKTTKTSNIIKAIKATKTTKTIKAIKSINAIKAIKAIMAIMAIKAIKSVKAIQLSFKKYLNKVHH